MSKLCEHCGAELPDDAEVCEKCKTFQTGSEEPRGRLKVKFTLPKIIFCIISIASLVGLFMIGRDLNRDIYEGGGFESALENVVAVENGKTSKLKSLAPREYWAKLLEETGFDIEEYIESVESEREESIAAAESEAETAETEVETEAPPKYSFKIIESTQLEDEQIERLDERVQTLCGTEEGTVIDAYSVNCTITLGDTETGETVERQLNIVRIRDNWYPLLGGNFMFKPEE